MAAIVPIAATLSSLGLCVKIKPMDFTGLQTLGFTLGASFASGLNLYATVSMLGLLQRFNVIQLPPSLQILSNPIVLTVAITLFVVEFVADKVPYFDSIWHAVHTFIRPPAAALLAYGAFAEVPESWRIAAAMLAGSVALTSHGAKASARAAANASPEPFSNSILSLGEDALAVSLTWMATKHPLITIAIVTLLVALCVFLAFRLFRFLAKVLRRIIGRKTPAAPAVVRPASPGTHI